MPSVKAANLGRKLRCLPAFRAQIGMALDAELISYSGQGLVVTAVLPVAGDTVRGEQFARLMHQTRVTRGARIRCGHAPGISVALRAVMSNEVGAPVSPPRGPGWSKRAIRFSPAVSRPATATRSSRPRQSRVPTTSNASS